MFIENYNHYKAAYGDNALVFFTLYIITILPCWYAVYKIVRSIKIKNNKKTIFWSLILMILFVLPYAYIALTISGLMWQVIAVLFLIPSYGFYKEMTSEKRKTLWDLYAQFYDILLKFEPYKNLVTDIVYEIKDRENIKKILDLGCGTGNILLELATFNKYVLVGMDSSDGMLNKASKKLKNKKTTLKIIDLNVGNLQLDDKYDTIIINNVLYTLDSASNLIMAIKNNINPDGLLIISEPLDGSSLMHLIREHQKRRGVRAIGDLIIFFIPFMVVGVINWLITLRNKNKKYHFFKLDELNKILNQSGYTVLKEKKVYCDQNILVVSKIS